MAAAPLPTKAGWGNNNNNNTRNGPSGANWTRREAVRQRRAGATGVAAAAFVAVSPPVSGRSWLQGRRQRRWVLAAGAVTAAPAEPALAEPQQPQQQRESPSSAVFCEPDNLSALLGQFIGRQDGFDSGLQLDGILAYYRRLGCSPQQLQAAVEALAPPPPPSARSTAPPAAAGAAASGASEAVAAAAADAASLRAGGAGRGMSAAVAVSEPEVWAPPAGLTQQLQLAAWELLAAAVAAAALAAYQSRPRGWSRRDLLEVRQSNIAGRGVFARAPIPAGTVLGAYPGRLRSASEMVAKCQEAPLAASYAFRTGDGRFLDPTDASGQPSPYPQPGWPWPLPTDVVLSYANEPPKGSPGTNTTVEDGPQPGELLFVAATDIPQGAEVLIDYGITYDRSGYGRK